MTLHAQLAAAAASRDDATVGALIDVHAREREGANLVALASRLYGPIDPDIALAWIERHPGAYFDGPMLADTMHPERLLALVPAADRPDGHAVRTIAEIVIAGRDRNAPVDAAETRWAAIVAKAPDALNAYRDGLLRIVARESLDRAATMLCDLGEWWGREKIGDGARAVLERMARVDPARAVAILATGGSPWNGVVWIEGVTASGLLIAEARDLVDELLAHGDAKVHLVLARALAATAELERLDRALHSSAIHGADALARALAPAVRRARRAGRTAIADAVRQRALAAIRAAETRATRNDDEDDDEDDDDDDIPRPSPVQVFEILAGPIPESTPWSKRGGP
jgi:hypothetical protein